MGLVHAMRSNGPLHQVGIWQHRQYLLRRDFLIVITHSAKAFAMAHFIVYLIIIVPHLQLVIVLWPRTIGIYIN
jgi:hypothetical protein